MTDAALETASPMTGLLHRLRRDWDAAVVPLVFLAMIAGFHAINPNYLSAANIVNVLNQFPILAMVTLGASIVIFTGGFDLSAGAVVALSGIIGAIVVDATGSVP
jgi:ribose/xylose/arabinose/galactoside ABC-type transport system permease subunit